MTHGGLNIGKEAEQIYRHLVEQGPTHPTYLARIFGPDAAGHVEQLRDIGLVVGDPPAARHPDHALAPRILDAEHEVARMRGRLDELRDLYQEHAAPRGPVETLTSRARTGAMFDELSLTAERRVMQFITYPFVRLTKLYGPLAPARLRDDGTLRTPRLRAIVEQAVLDDADALAGIRHVIDLGAEVRVAATLPMKLIIADDRAMLPKWRDHADQVSALLVHGTSLLDVLVRLFEVQWASSVCFQSGHGLVGRDMLIVQHLVAGQTLDMIARTLGVSVRTVQRRIEQICARAGVASRVQLISFATRHWVRAESA